VLAEKETDFIRFYRLKSTVAREQVEREERSENEFQGKSSDQTCFSISDPMS
jgi:hypothetical protein